MQHLGSQQAFAHPLAALLPGQPMDVFVIKGYHVKDGDKTFWIITPGSGALLETLVDTRLNAAPRHMLSPAPARDTGQKHHSHATPLPFQQRSTIQTHDATGQESDGSIQASHTMMHQQPGTQNWKATAGHSMVQDPKTRLGHRYSRQG